MLAAEWICREDVAILFSDMIFHRINFHYTFIICSDAYASNHC